MTTKSAQPTTSHRHIATGLSQRELVALSLLLCSK
jgi:hypothetical protein